MILSAGPFITCMITITVLYLFFYLSLKFQSAFLINGNRLFYIIMIFILFRMAIPINFPFTYSIYSTKFLPKIIGFLYIPIYNTRFLVQDLLYTIWISVSVIQLLRFFIRKIKFTKMVKEFSVSQDSSYSYLYDIAKNHIDIPVKIAILPTPVSPGIMGIFKPILILPDVNSFSEQELNFIFAHEFYHYKKHDLWLLLLTDIVCCIHWWNPLTYFMKKWFSLSMEVVNDQIILKEATPDIHLDYATFILRLSKEIQTNKLRKTNTLNFINKSTSNLEIRIQYLCSDFKLSNSKNTINVLQILFMLSLIIFSTIFVFEASEPVTNIGIDGTFIISDDNAYFLRSDNGFELYVNDKKIIMFETIPDDLKTLPIKQNK